MKLTRRIGGTFLGVIMALIVATAAPGQEGTVKAVSAWQGQGHFYRVATELALFIGAFGLERITGDGDFAIRSPIADLAVPNESVQETAAGLAVWPSLRDRIPQRARVDTWHGCLAR